MSPQKFISLLQYPHVSDKPGMVEVEHLLMKYPYCQSLHILKAKMYRLAEHPDAEKALNKAATYTCNRTFLYDTMNQLHDTPVKKLEMPAGLMDLTAAFEGEVLTLKDPAELAIADFEIVEESSSNESGSISSNENENLEKAKEDLNTSTPQHNKEEKAKEDLNTSTPQHDNTTTHQHTLPPMEALEIPSLSEEEPPAIEEPPLEIPSLSLYEEESNIEPVPVLEIPALGLDESDISGSRNVNDNENIEKTKKEPSTTTQQHDNTTTHPTTPQDEFSQWLSGLKAPQAGKRQVETEATPISESPKLATPKTPLPVAKKVSAEKKEKQKRKEGVIEDKGKRLRKLIKRSVTQNNEAVSETLAKVLVIQGKKKKARWMYAQLSLKFPEKSAYFAAQIEKLKK